VIIMRYK